MNVVFKVYWNNPIEMVVEAGTQQLTFEVPLGAIISNPSGGGTASYPSFTGNAAKVLTVNATEDDVEWTTDVIQVYVDTQDGLLQDQIDLKANTIDVNEALDLKANTIDVNEALDLKADLIGGLIPASQLPSYVDDVLEYENVAAFPATGETGKIYVETTGNTTYRWSGTGYIKITSGEVSSVAGKAGVVTLTKSDVGLANVDNTADSAKNVASATKLTTACTIGGVAFDGTGDINLDVYSKAETDSIAATPNATETVAGKAKIATTAIAQAGVNDTDIMTPLKVRSVSFGQGQTRKTRTLVSGVEYTNTNNKPIVVGFSLRSDRYINAQMPINIKLGAITVIGNTLSSTTEYRTVYEFTILPQEKYTFTISNATTFFDVAWEIS